MYINLRYMMNTCIDKCRQGRVRNIMLSLFRWFRSKFSGRRLKEILMRALEGGYVPRTADVFVMYWRHRIFISKAGRRWINPCGKLVSLMLCKCSKIIGLGC